jgi:hypothetical protein
MDGYQGLKDAVAGILAGKGRGALLRLPGGTGTGAVVKALAATGGAGLVVVPIGVREQVTKVLGEGLPGVAVGEWGEGTTVEVASPTRAANQDDGRHADHFAWILFEECHEAYASYIATVAERFAGARQVEILRMPAPHVGNLAHASELDLAGGAEPGRT